MKKIIFDDAISYDLGASFSQLYARRFSHINIIITAAERTITVDGDEISVSIFMNELPRYINTFRYKVRDE